MWVGRSQYIDKQVIDTTFGRVLVVVVVVRAKQPGGIDIEGLWK